MQAKKKAMPIKKNLVKKKPQKSYNDNSDTINTTKQKTFATIEQTFEFQDHKTSTRTTHYTSKRQCLDKMQANKLSPFSSPGNSLSPKSRKSFSPTVVKQKQAKKIKKNQGLQTNISYRKSSNFFSKSNKAVKQKIKNSQKVKAEFQNQFLKRMYKVQSFHQKKITELSQQQMQASIRKISKPLMITKRQAPSKNKKGKRQIIKQMHTKIKQKYSKIYPNLKANELKLLSAIVLIQRLWRQTKVKMMIGQFISPRNISYNQTFGKIEAKYLKQNMSVISVDNEQNQQTMKTEKSFPSLSPKSLKMQQQAKGQSSYLNLNNSQNNSDVIVTPEKSCINLKDLEVSDQLSDASSTKAKQILRYIDMYRQVTLKSKRDKKKKNISKPNAFNFPESLSEKCLLQNLYRKRVTNIKNLKQKNQNKNQGLDLFLPSRNLERSKQQYISPKKPEILQLQERFYTQAQDEQFNQVAKIQKQPLKLEQQTVGSIGNVSKNILQLLIKQFSQQFQAFSTKKCLKKKKKLPGIQINNEYIMKYLDNFVDFVKGHYQNHMQSSFTRLSAKNFLKIFRVAPLDQDLFQLDEDQQDQQDLNFPVLPSEAFFSYQPIYEQKIFTIKEQDKKYQNFVSSLIKIHNKSLVDCFSEYLQKLRIQSIQFPWDKLSTVKSQQKIQNEVSKKLDLQIKGIKNYMIMISNTRLGRIHKKDLDVQQINLLKSLKQDYKREGKDWSDYQDLLQIRLQITQTIVSEILKEAADEIQAILCHENSNICSNNAAII